MARKTIKTFWRTFPIIDLITFDSIKRITSITTVIKRDYCFEFSLLFVRNLIMDGFPVL